MKKKILTILLCGIMILGITGCGNKANKSNEHICTYEDGKYKDTRRVFLDKNDIIIKYEEIRSEIYDNDDELNSDYKISQEECKNIETKGLKCSIEKNGMTLTITIKGNIEQYNYENTTWEMFKENIEKLPRKYICK